MPPLSDVLRTNNIDPATLAPFATIDHHELFTLTTPGSNAVPLWKKLRALTHSTGHYPVILGDPDELKERFGWRSKDTTTASLLDSATHINVADEMKQKRELDPEYYENLDEGEWPAKIPVPTEHFTIPTDIRTNKFVPQCPIALIPTTDPITIPAFLHYGGWNDCPSPEAHVAWFRHWHDRHGAEIVGASSDVIEMIVSRPPTTREAALELAREQYA